MSEQDYEDLGKTVQAKSKPEYIIFQIKNANLSERSTDSAQVETRNTNIDDAFSNAALPAAVNTEKKAMYYLLAKLIKAQYGISADLTVIATKLQNYFISKKPEPEETEST